MDHQKKRKRDVECPIITYRVGNRTFERLLKEDSLQETQEAIRQKLKVGDDARVTLAQLRGAVVIDLDDEDDFDAFHTAAHKASGAIVKVTVIQENGVPASHFSVAPSESISNAAAASTRSVHFTSPEDEQPATNGKRKVSAIESVNGDESASAPRRGRPPKRRKEDAVVSEPPAADPTTVEEPEAPAPAPEKKKRGRPRIHPRPEDVQSASQTGKPIASGVTAREPPAEDARVDTPREEAAPVVIKRKPGRPRKHPLPEEKAQQTVPDVVAERQPRSRSRKSAGVGNEEFAQELADAITSGAEANAAAEEALKKGRRTRSKSRSRADGAVAKLKAVLPDPAPTDGAGDAPAASAPVIDEDNESPLPPVPKPRGRKKKPTPSGVDADDEEASMDVDVAPPKERRKRKKRHSNEGPAADDAVGPTQSSEPFGREIQKAAVNGDVQGVDDENNEGPPKKARKKRKKKQDAVEDKTQDVVEESGYRTGELSEAEIDEARGAARQRFLDLMEQHQLSAVGKLWKKEKKTRKRVETGHGADDAMRGKDGVEQGEEEKTAVAAEVDEEKVGEEQKSINNKAARALPVKRKPKRKTIDRSSPSPATHAEMAGLPTPTRTEDVADPTVSRLRNAESASRNTPPNSPPLSLLPDPTNLEAIIRGPRHTFTLADITSDDDEEEPQRIDLDPEEDEEDELMTRGRRKKRALTKRHASESSDEDPIAEAIVGDGEEEADEVVDDPTTNVEEQALADEAHPEIARRYQNRPPQVRRRSSGQHRSFASLDGLASSSEVDRSAEAAYSKGLAEDHPSDVEDAVSAPAVAAVDGHETDPDDLTLGYPADAMSDAAPPTDREGSPTNAQAEDVDQVFHDAPADAMDEDPIEAPPPTQSAPPSPIESIIPDLHSPFQSTPRQTIAGRMKDRNGQIRSIMPSPVADAIRAANNTPDGSFAMKGFLLPPWTQPERDTRQSPRLPVRRQSVANGSTSLIGARAPPMPNFQTPNAPPRVGLTSSSQPVDDTQPSLTQWTTMPNVPPSPSTVPEDSVLEKDQMLDQLRSSPEAAASSPELRRKSGQARPPLFFPSDSQSKYPFSQYEPPQLQAAPEPNGHSPPPDDGPSGGEEEEEVPGDADEQVSSEEEDSEKEIRESMQQLSRAPSQTRPSQYRTLTDIASGTTFGTGLKRPEVAKKSETPPTQDDLLYGGLAQESDESPDEDNDDAAQRGPSHIPKARQAGRKSSTEKTGLST